MALHIIETQMMLSRPVEATSEKAHALAKQAMNPDALRHDEQQQVEKQLNSPQAAETVEEGKVREEHGRQEGGQNEKSEQQQEEEAAKDELEQLKKQATEKLLNLPVERGRYAKRDEHRVDITL